MKNSTQLLEHLSAEIPRNNPVLDSMMFVRHNASQWQDPSDFGFEPSPVWLDDDIMATDPMSKTFLMNILAKSKGSLSGLRHECDSRRREVEGAKRVRQAIREGKDKRDEAEVLRAQFYQQEALHDAERRKITAEVEVSTITSNVGDVSVGAKTHPFRPQTFKIPTNCDLCGDRIWGLSAKGMSCGECGFTCHTKCELKVPADCPGELDKEQKKAKKVERQAEAAAAAAAPPEVNGGGGGAGGGGHVAPSLTRSDTMGSMNTLSSGYANSGARSVSGATTRSSMADSDVTPAAAAPAPARRRIVAPPPAQYITSNPNGDSPFEAPQKSGKMLFAYQATNDGEISISENQDFTLLEPDDGSGWIKIKPSSGSGAAGLVPALYAELSSARASMVGSIASLTPSSDGGSGGGGGAKPKKQGPAVAPRRGGGAKKTLKHVEALYTYSANGEGEVDMEEGERMVLIQPDQGDGWCEVEARAGKGVVPAGWVREV